MGNIENAVTNKKIIRMSYLEVGKVNVENGENQEDCIKIIDFAGECYDPYATSHYEIIDFNYPVNFEIKEEERKKIETIEKIDWVKDFKNIIRDSLQNEDMKKTLRKVKAKIFANKALVFFGLKKRFMLDEEYYYLLREILVRLGKFSEENIDAIDKLAKKSYGEIVGDSETNIDNLEIIFLNLDKILKEAK